jgi:hypothetical protein
MRLLTASGNGNGADVPIRQWGNRGISQLYTLYVWGTFDGGAVTLEISLDGTEWFSVTGVSISAKGCVNVEFRAPHVRAVVAGGGASVAIDAFLA